MTVFLCEGNITGLKGDGINPLYLVTVFSDKHLILDVF